MIHLCLRLTSQSDVSYYRPCTGRAALCLIAEHVLLAAVIWPPLFRGPFQPTASFFFQDPERITPDDPQTLFSPADGIVCLLMQCRFPLSSKRGSPGLARQCL